ncbi:MULTISPECIES: hypothetical protein [unclassified Bradyrhizobium]
MKNTTRLFVVAAAAMMASDVCAAPVDVTRLPSQRLANVVQVRLACDQNCHCWRTLYRERSHRRTIDERQDPNYCPGGGHYNGHYRTGPGTGLSFDSRLPVRSLPFPF